MVVFVFSNDWTVRVINKLVGKSWGGDDVSLVILGI